MAYNDNMAILELTDGTDVVSLLTGGISLVGWNPVTSAMRSGGLYHQSPFADGKQLVFGALDNCVETFNLAIYGGSPDSYAEMSRSLHNMMLKAVQYWLSAGSKPVYLRARSRGESNIRYAMIMNASISSTSSNYDQPFLQPDGRAVGAVTLLLERDQWQSTPPGVSVCQPLTQVASVRVTDLNSISVAVTAAGDDISWLAGMTGANPVTSDYLHVGSVAATSALISTWPLLAGLVNTPNLLVKPFSAIRFTGISVPKGATISSATLTMGIHAIQATEFLHISVRAMAMDNVPVMSTLVSAKLGMGVYPLTTAQTVMAVPDIYLVTPTTHVYNIRDIIQEIVRRSGWASGNALALVMSDVGPDISLDGGASEPRYMEYDSYDHPGTNGIPILHLSYIVDDTAIVGPESACSGVAISNAPRLTNITQLFKQYTVAATSSNLLLADPPYTLIERDNADFAALWMGVRTKTSSGGNIDGIVPASNIVFNCSGWGVPEGINWKYAIPSGGSYTLKSLTVVDGTQGLHQPGMISFTIPADFAPANFNGIVGYWIVAQPAGAMAAGYDSPVQVAGTPYSASFPFVDAKSTDMFGSLPASLRVDATCASLTASPLAGEGVNRLLVARRSLDRGLDFNAIINTGRYGASLGIETRAITNSIHYTSEIVDNVALPAGSQLVVGTDDTVDLPWAICGQIIIGGGAVSQYCGRYRMLMRALQSGGAVGDVEIYFRLSGDGMERKTDLVVPQYTQNIGLVLNPNYLELMDFGVVNIPSSSMFMVTDQFAYCSLALCTRIRNTVGALTNPTLIIYDVILLPIDEWCVDTVGTAAMTGNTICVDSLSNPKEPLRSYVYMISPDYQYWLSSSSTYQPKVITPTDYSIRYIWQPIGLRPYLNPAVDQRIWMLSASMSNGVWFSDVTSAMMVNLSTSYRYRGLRGAK